MMGNKQECYYHKKVSYQKKFYIERLLNIYFQLLQPFRYPTMERKQVLYSQGKKLLNLCMYVCYADTEMPFTNFRNN